MWFRARRLAVAVLLLAVVMAGVTIPAAGQASSGTTVMQVRLQPDGDARWTVSARFTLADANDTAAFDRLADEHVSGDVDVLRVDPFEAAAALASEATGRDMAVTTVDRTASRANDTGELRLSFTWANFSRVTDGGERLVLGDVFTTPTDTWLPGLRAGQVLVIEFPDGYAVQSSSRALDNGSIRVVGPASFEPGRPSATLERTGGATPVSPTPDQGFGVPSALTGGAVVALLLVVAYLLYRRRQQEAAAAGDEEPPGAPPTTADDPGLLSDEERVLRLLRAEGGRMKQVDIVEETDWSNAKVSQLLSSMAEEGLVEKLRIGRENLISLPDDD